MPKQSLRPGPGRIAIRPFPPSHELQIGDGKILYLLTDTKNDAVMGTVVYAYDLPYVTGDGAVVEPSYKMGDVVIIGKYIGTRISINREELILLREDAVIAQLIEDGSESQD